MPQNRWYRAGRVESLFLSASAGLVAALLVASCGQNTRIDDENIASKDAGVSDVMQGDASDAASVSDTRPSEDGMRLEDGVLLEDGATSPQVCAPYTEKTQTGTLGPVDIDEASGLAASWAHEGLMWTHNDSGDSARVFLIRTDGALVAEVQLAGVDEALDFEDIAVAPCAAGSAESCVFVADVGDNLRARDAVVIYRFPEPQLPADHHQEVGSDQEAITLAIEDVHAIWFDYPDAPRDVETLMVHPRSGEIYVVEKNDTPHAPVFRIPQDASSPDEPARAVEIASLYMEGRENLVAMITAGDISPNGREFTVRTYLESYTYCLPETDSEGNSEDNFEDVFKLSPTRALLPILAQAESLAYDRAGDAIWITSEGAHSPIIRVERAN